MFSLFLQLCLAALCSAAPIADDFTTLNSNATQYGTGGGIVSFIVLVVDILVWRKRTPISRPPPTANTIHNVLTRASFLVEVLKSSRPVSHKLLWSVLVFVFPIGGIIIYWLLSDRQKWNNGNGYEAIVDETR